MNICAQSVRAKIDRLSIPEPNSGCWLWLGGVDSDGYGMVHLDGKMYRAHRAAWSSVNGPIPSGVQVLHRCDNPICVNVAHLFLGTHADNMADKDKKNRARHTIGSANGNAKLSDDAVRQIVEAAHRGEMQRSIGARFGVSQGAVSAIVLGKRWRHLEKATSTGAAC